MYNQLAAIKNPAPANTHALCRDSVTSQGKLATTEATVAPNPTNTRNDGSAQQTSALTDAASAASGVAPTCQAFTAGSALTEDTAWFGGEA